MPTSSALGMSFASLARPSVLTPEMIQQMIMSAFSTLGLQGNDTNPSTSWLVDFGASNHMTKSFDTLCNVCPYDGSSHIHIANGSHLAINEVGYINSSFRDVCVSPNLYTSLFSVGQLVDNNCDAHFSRNSYLVQNQGWG